MRMASRLSGGSSIAARRASTSRLLRPASTRRRVRSVRMKVQFPELLLASTQILTIARLRSPKVVGYRKCSLSRGGRLSFQAQFYDRGRGHVPDSVVIVVEKWLEFRDRAVVASFTKRLADR